MAYKPDFPDNRYIPFEEMESVSRAFGYLVTQGNCTTASAREFIATGNPRVLRDHTEQKADDSAELNAKNADTVDKLVREGWTPESAIEFVKTGDVAVLVHTGFLSVQLYDPGKTPTKVPPGYSASRELADAVVDGVNKAKKFDADVVSSFKRAAYKGLLGPTIKTQYEAEFPEELPPKLKPGETAVWPRPKTIGPEGSDGNITIRFSQTDDDLPSPQAGTLPDKVIPLGRGSVKRDGALSVSPGPRVDRPAGPPTLPHRASQGGSRATNFPKELT